MSVKIGDRITHRKIFNDGLDYIDFRFGDIFSRVRYYVCSENKDVIGYIIDRPIIDSKNFQRTIFLRKEEIITLDEAIKLLDTMLEEKKEKIMRSLHAIK